MPSPWSPSTGMMIHMYWPCTRFSHDSRDHSAWECVQNCVLLRSRFDTHKATKDSACAASSPAVAETVTPAAAQHTSAVRERPNEARPMRPCCATSRPISQPRSTSPVNTNTHTRRPMQCCCHPANCAERWSELPRQVQGVSKEPTCTRR